MNKETLAPGIVVYYDACSTLDELKDLVYFDDLEWYPGMIAANRDISEDITNISAKLNTDIRDCLSIPLLYEREALVEIAQKNPNNDNFKMYIKLHDAISPMFAKIEKDYLIDHNIDYMTWHSRLELLSYKAGHFFEDHIDNIPGIPRTVSVVYYLNDDYEGGELYFSRLGLKIKPKANSMIVFPSNYVYNHSAEPVISGNKIAIASFLA